MSRIELTATIDRFPTAGAWTISRGSVTEVEVVTAHARLDGHVGRGECRPYPRYDEFPEGVVADIEAGGGRAKAACLDITDEGAVKALVASASRRWEHNGCPEHRLDACATGLLGAWCFIPRHETEKI